MLRRCKDQKCKALFEPAVWNQKYCCERCRERSNAAQDYANHWQRILDKNTAWRKAWKEKPGNRLKLRMYNQDNRAFKKIPCPNGCGHKMNPRSKMCRPCSNMSPSAPQGKFRRPGR